MNVPARAVALLSLLLVLSPASALLAPPTTLAEGLSRATGLPVEEPAPRAATLAELVLQADARLGIARDPAELDVLATLDPRLADVAADLLAAVLAAAAERDAAFAAVSDAEIAALSDTETLTPEAADVLARVDRVRLQLAAMRLARAVDLARPELEALALEASSSSSALAPSSLSPSLALPPPGAPPLVDVFPVLGIDPLGVANTFPHDYVLSIDLGGNDVYDNNAGGSILVRGFIVGDPSTFGPSAAGFTMGGEFEDSAEAYTASLAIDVAGDDAYGVYKTPSLVGGSRDKVCTAGPLVRRVVIQGSGSGGIGMLADLAGNDQYRGKTLAQGNGHIAGVGILFDAIGDDRYTAIRSSQGSAVLQGVGVQLDLAGDDVHEMKSPPGGIWNVDRGRCDFGERLAMGTAVLQGAALFVDASGADAYDVDSQALGHSEAAQSVGTFLDLAGADDYNGFPGRGDGVQLVTQTPMGGGVFKDV